MWTFVDVKRRSLTNVDLLYSCCRPDLDVRLHVRRTQTPSAGEVLLATFASPVGLRHMFQSLSHCLSLKAATVTTLYGLVEFSDAYD